jgi:hypothetical protein
MGHQSSESFRTFHALRIKGFATTETLADMTVQPLAAVHGHLEALHGAEHVQFREARSLWQLTPGGREAHLELLSADIAPALPSPTLAEAYEQFLVYNSQFKELCGAWQLVDGQPNDHSDAGHDAAVLENLAHLHAATEPIVSAFGSVFERMAPYRPRLESALAMIHEGHTNKFTGVMCGSYHDVWMELHEDLILTQGISRHAEGSF